MPSAARCSARIISASKTPAGRGSNVERLYWQKRTLRPCFGVLLPGALRARLGEGESLSESLLRGCLEAPDVGPKISPSASLRLRVEFQRFFMALSVLHRADRHRFQYCSLLPLPPAREALGGD